MVWQRRCVDGQADGWDIELVAARLEDASCGTALFGTDHTEVAEPTNGPGDGVLRLAERCGQRSDRHHRDESV